MHPPANYHCKSLGEPRVLNWNFLLKISLGKTHFLKYSRQVINWSIAFNVLQYIPVRIHVWRVSSLSCFKGSIKNIVSSTNFCIPLILYTIIILLSVVDKTKFLSYVMLQAEKPVSTSFSTSHEMSGHAVAGRPSASNASRSPCSTARTRARSLCAPDSGIPDLRARFLKLCPLVLC